MELVGQLQPDGRFQVFVPVPLGDNFGIFMSYDINFEDVGFLPYLIVSSSCITVHCCRLMFVLQT